MDGHGDRSLLSVDGTCLGHCRCSLLAVTMIIYFTSTPSPSDQSYLSLSSTTYPSRTHEGFQRNPSYTEQALTNKSNQIKSNQNSNSVVSTNLRTYVYWKGLSRLICEWGIGYHTLLQLQVLKRPASSNISSECCRLLLFWVPGLG